MFILDVGFDLFRGNISLMHLLFCVDGFVTEFEVTINSCIFASKENHEFCAEQEEGSSDISNYKPFTGNSLRPYKTNLFKNML